MRIIPKAYNHEEFEDKIYAHWEKSGYFRPEIKNKKNSVIPASSSVVPAKVGIHPDPRSISRVGKTTNGSPTKSGMTSSKKPFVIAMPPPNVTGKLHIGHALFVSIEDIMTRYHRLLGEETLWVPGTDHAGIATQTVVDKMLKKKGINRYELGREKFVEEVWKWKEEYGGTITRQLRRLGASCDWSRERFTLDEGLSHAVKVAFVDLYNKGLIYQGLRVVNWCPKCHTAIADDEVEHEEQKTKLYYFRYDKNFPITIATTRPETKLGDTGVAVNPNDERYKQYIGKKFNVNIDGIEREILVFGDRGIDTTFGSGAVGVTPAHSAIDEQMGKANDLPSIQVIDENGKMNENAGKYQGLKAKEAGQKLIEYFESDGLLEKTEDYENSLSICYRCGGAIEPIPSLQWFVKMKPLAEKAIKAVKSGEIEIIPKRFEKVYFHWMENIRDWCISRQLWWGHRLPVWYRKPESISNNQETITSKNPNPNNQYPNEKLGIENCNLDINCNLEIGDCNLPSGQQVYVGKTPPSGEGWVQDPDVLDTWFSSGLWPFSTLNWPDTESSDYKKYFPTTVMETGYDILFFWVARMIMMSLELTGKVPFKTVYLHGLVRDEQNRKMSKSLGNVLDPLDIIPKYGTDALRMALVVGSTPGQDIAVGESKIKGYRNFSNKIWNASRFVALRISGGDLASGEIGSEKIFDLKIDEKISTKADKKILKKHEHVVASVSKKIEQFKFSQAGEELYDYFWHTFCDVYIEAAKGQLQSQISNLKSQNENSESKIINNTGKILTKVLSESLVMLHPFIPFITEAVWQELRNIYPSLCESIMIASWPEASLKQLHRTPNYQETSYS